MARSLSKMTVVGVALAATLALTGCGAKAQVWTGPSQTVTAYPGSRHCNEESVLFLNLGSEMYVFDSGTVIARELLTSEPEKNAALPADAIDIGLRRGNASLWLAADGDAVYVVSDPAAKPGETAQLWPRAVEPLGCD